MISRQGEVKLMDFGIARDDTLSDLTETGTGLGTPSYMSPEQILGDKLDFRSDIFSLGIVLYQMLTGRKPFVEDDSRTVMQKIRLDRYVAPRKLNPRGAARSSSASWRAAWRRCRRTAIRRTQALIDDLMEFLAPRVPINHNARLVMYLREVGVITDEEADEILEAAGSRAAKKRDNDRRWCVTLRLAMSAMLVGITVTGGVIQSLGGAARARHDEQESMAGVLTPARAGFLQLVVDPWAEVHVDGQLLTVTPTAERFMLSPGRHFVRLSHPQFQTVTREVEIERGKIERLKVTLDAPNAKATSAK